MAGLDTGSALRLLAINKGHEIATLFLSAVVKARNDDPVLNQNRDEMTAKEISDQMTIAFQAMVQTFIMSLLRSVQKTSELVAATGLLTSQGIPWDTENFEPNEIFAEADRLLREAEAEDKGSY